MFHDRTDLRHPSLYVDGRSWEDYFRFLREAGYINHGQDSGEPAPDLDDSESQSGAIEVTVPAHEVESGWPSALSAWRNRALANDWRIKMGHSAAHHEDTFWKNGNLRKPAHDEEQWWMNAVKGNMYVTVSYTTIGGKVVSANTYRTVRGLGRLLSDAEMKRILEDEDD